MHVEFEYQVNYRRDFNLGSRGGGGGGLSSGANRCGLGLPSPPGALPLPLVPALPNLTGHAPTWLAELSGTASRPRDLTVLPGAALPS